MTFSGGILIVGQNASARFGGEAILPLKYFEILHRCGHDVRLIAHARNRAELAAHLPQAADRISYVEDTAAQVAIWRVGSWFPARLSGYVFGTLLSLVGEVQQRRLIRALVRDHAIAVVHQPIPVSPRAPSMLHGFGVPVVIGPMNGGMTYPPGYEALESALARRSVALGRAVARLANRVLPGKARAAALLVANARTGAALPVTGHPRVIEMVENGVDAALFTPRRPRAPDGAFRLAFVGRLVGWKAVDITLAAVAQARAGGVDVRLDIVGDGPEHGALAAQVGALGLVDVVRFHGFVPQAACAQVLAGCDALILNSVWECGGAVVLEAMATGLPVIASDWGGPADYLDPTCGILVPPAPRAEFSGRIAAAILRLAGNPDLCARMGAAGVAKVRDRFDWDRKVDRILAVYAEVVARPAARSS